MSLHPDDLLYSPGHVWCKKEPDGNIRLGMTYHYQEQLKNIVYIDFVKTGTVLKPGTPFASFESSKTASELASPVSGTLIATNPLAVEKPGLVNKDPYGQGWMAMIKPDDPEELKNLLSAKKYISMILR